MWVTYETFQKRTQEMLWILFRVCVAFSIGRFVFFSTIYVICKATSAILLELYVRKNFLECYYWSDNYYNLSWEYCLDHRSYSAQGLKRINLSTFCDNIKGKIKSIPRNRDCWQIMCFFRYWEKIAAEKIAGKKRPREKKAEEKKAEEKMADGKNSRWKKQPKEKTADGKNSRWNKQPMEKTADRK